MQQILLRAPDGFDMPAQKAMQQPHVIALNEIRPV
jgi:hypothetical protein